jgi:uncharacterized protein with PIN domain
MLVRLGKWLRVAGYDTLIAGTGMKDRELLDQAICEGRILITRDHKFLEIKGSQSAVFLLDGNDMHSWVQTLSEKLAVNWLYRPFSRCLLCNRELQPGSGPHSNLLPDYVTEENIAVYHCSDCAKPYWRGGHVQRMRRKLEQWAELFRSDQ